MLARDRMESHTGPSAVGTSPKVVYWHRDLPPIDAEIMGEHTVEATSPRVPGTLAYRDELWNRCHDQLMTEAGSRLAQEVARLGGDYAHVLDESIDGRHDAATDEAWLHGRFTYVLYRRPLPPRRAPAVRTSDGIERPSGEGIPDAREPRESDPACPTATAVDTSSYRR